MTTEQIADFRRRTFSLNVTPKEILRVLEEREKLLGALKDAKAKLGDARSALSHCWAREEPPDKESVEDADAAEDAAEVAIMAAEGYW